MEEHLAKARVLPPGSHPSDPCKSEIDAVAFAIDRLNTHVHWIAEHHLSFLAARSVDEEVAERELELLALSAKEATVHIVRLSELLLAGYAIDATKKLPSDLMRQRQTLDIPEKPISN
ncbi:hypothetical protein NA78x_000011 [Anatilimnocola sp. NA78]|uniref:hypothetical protein n=1 Tax=Anatilimnocola sp. NA78 TaxID=3415683 RepID=UPI003CE46374